MKVPVRFYRVKDEGRTIFICEDVGHLKYCLRMYFDPYVYDAIDGLVNALLNGNPTDDFEAYLGIAISTFFVEMEF